MVIRPHHTTAIVLGVLAALLYAGLPESAAQPVSLPQPLQGRSIDQRPPLAHEPSEDLLDTFIQVSEEGLLSLNMQGAKLHAVLNGLIRKTKRNIVFDEGAAEQRIYVRLFNLTLEETLDAILKKYGYGYRDEGNVLYIYPLEELEQIMASERELITRTYRLNYISPLDAEAMLLPFLSPIGEVTVGPVAQSGLGSETGGQGLAIEDLIIIRDYEENHQLVEEMLPQIDKRPKQVLVEATILRATLSENNALGIDWNLVAGVDFQDLGSAVPPIFRNGTESGGTRGGVGGGGVGGLGGAGTTDGLTGGEGGEQLISTLPNTVPLGKLDDLTFGARTDFAGAVPDGGLSLGIVTDHVAVFIRALEAVTDVAVMANPKLLTLNKQVGHFLVGARDGYRTTSVTETTATETINFLETGTQLRFRPYISNDGYVRMEVNPSDSTGGVNALGLPFERTTETTANILVKDGHTLLIAGLFREVDSAGRSQVPFLGSIPVLGYAFANTSDNTLREEVIILLTVNIVDDEESYADHSADVLDDVERMRVGIRNSMQAHGRERLAQSNYHTALEYATKGDVERALWHTNLAIHNRPTFVPAIKLKEELLQERAWDDEGTSTRMFMQDQILRERGMSPRHFERPALPAPQALPDPDTESSFLNRSNYVYDECPDDPQKIAPGICGCGVPDEDRDTDGVADCQDRCPQDPTKHHPGVCGCGSLDLDSDEDGAVDCQDECPQDPLKQKPGACGCGAPETDADGDGAMDCRDRCPQDATKSEPGMCGCGSPDIDTDQDGTMDCRDKCPNDSQKTEPGQCGCQQPDTDSDSDGTADCADQCPDDPQKTLPGQCGCGRPDTDSDGDGTADCFDRCPQNAEKTTPGECGCQIPDSDSDGDGAADCNDRCPDDPAKSAPGSCGCGQMDKDTDGDGAADCVDACSADPQKTVPGECGCGTPDIDTDQDGTPDCNDRCPNDPDRVVPGQEGCQAPADRGD